MSFSSAVKEELCASITDRDKKYACLYGMLLFCKCFNQSGVILQTEQEGVAELFCVLADDVLSKTGVVSVTASPKSNQSTVFTLRVENRYDRLALLSRYKVPSDELWHRIQMENVDVNGLDGFLSGVYLVSGSAIDPNREYHLEFVTPSESLAKELGKLLAGLGMNAKISERKNQQVVYIKGSENIEDLLTFMGAQMAALEIMNIKILKDVRNKANRIANCDTANIEKTVVASARQIEDIEVIQERMGLDSLSDELREVAEIRLEYPELSLREIGQMLENPIGRSGVNHRIKKLAQIAKDITDFKKMI